LVICYMPVWQSRGLLVKVAKEIFADISGKGTRRGSVLVIEATNVEVEGREEAKRAPKEG
jgi:hypothetical protein